MPRLASVLIATSAIFTTASALAEPRPVQVLALQSDDAVEQAQALTFALKRAAGESLVAGDYSLEVLTLALGCPDIPDAVCLGKIANKIESEAFVWGTLQQDAGKLDLKLNLYRRGEQGRSTEVRYKAAIVDDAALNDIADRALGKLLADKPRSASAGPREETGKLVLAAEELSGEIVIDGAPAGEIRDGHAQLELPVGEHDISVRVAGYRDAEGTVTILQSKPALLRLQPQKIGVTRAAQAESDANSTDSESNASAGWAAIVVGGAFAVLGVYSTVRVNSINHDSDFDTYRAGISQNDDACAQADRDISVTGAASPSRISDLCSQSKTFEALQYVFFGLGAVAAGTGALILLTDDKAPEAKTNALRARRPRTAGIEPTMSVGQHSAAIGLRLDF